MTITILSTHSTSRYTGKHPSMDDTTPRIKRPKPPVTLESHEQELQKHYADVARWNMEAQPKLDAKRAEWESRVRGQNFYHPGSSTGSQSAAPSPSIDAEQRTKIERLQHYVQAMLSTTVGVEPFIAASRLPEYKEPIGRGDLSREYLTAVFKDAERMLASSGTDKISSQLFLDTNITRAHQPGSEPVPTTPSSSASHTMVDQSGQQQIRNQAARVQDMDLQRNADGKTPFDIELQKIADKLHVSPLQIRTKLFNNPAYQMSPEQFAIFTGMKRPTTPGELEHQLIEAAPGSGKTDVMTTMALKMIASGTNMNDVHFVSPTHSGTEALREKLDKIREMLPEEHSFAPRVSTLSSFAYQKFFKRDVDEESGQPTGQPLIEQLLKTAVSPQILTDNASKKDFESIGKMEQAQTASREAFFNRHISAHTGMYLTEGEIKGKLREISQLKQNDRGAYQTTMQAGYDLLKRPESTSKWRSEKNIPFAASVAIYEQAMRAGEGGKRIIDQDDLISFFANAAKLEKVRAPRAMFIDEAQDLSSEGSRAIGHLARMGTRMIMGGDPSQVNIHSAHGAYQVLPKLFQQAGLRLQHAQMTENFRLSPVNTGLINAFARSLQQKGTHTAPLQIGMRPVDIASNSRGISPKITVASSLSELNDYRLRDLTNHIGLSIGDIVNNINTGKEAFAGALNAPEMAPVISQTSRTRAEFAKVLEQSVRANMHTQGIHQDALKPFMAKIYTEKTPASGGAPSLIHNLKINQARSRSFGTVFSDVTRTGLWDRQEDYERNMYTMLSRARGQNYIYGAQSTYQDERNRLGQFQQAENLGGTLVPHGWSKILASAGQDIMANYGVTEDHLPGVYSRALTYAPQLVESQEKPQVSRGFPLHRFLTDIVGFGKTFAESVGSGSGGAIQSMGVGSEQLEAPTTDIDGRGSDTDTVQGYSYKFSPQQLGGKARGMGANKHLLDLASYLSGLLSGSYGPNPVEQIANIAPNGVFPEKPEDILATARTLSSFDAPSDDFLEDILSQTALAKTNFTDEEKDWGKLGSDTTFGVSPEVKTQVQGLYSNRQFLGHLFDEQHGIASNEWKDRYSGLSYMQQGTSTEDFVRTMLASDPMVRGQALLYAQGMLGIKDRMHPRDESEMTSSETEEEKGNLKEVLGHILKSPAALQSPALQAYNQDAIDRLMQQPTHHFQMFAYNQKGADKPADSDDFWSYRRELQAQQKAGTLSTAAMTSQLGSFMSTGPLLNQAIQHLSQDVGAKRRTQADAQQTFIDLALAQVPHHPDLQSIHKELSRDVAAGRMTPDAMLLAFGKRVQPWVQEQSTFQQYRGNAAAYIQEHPDIYGLMKSPDALFGIAKDMRNLGHTEVADYLENAKAIGENGSGLTITPEYMADLAKRNPYEHGFLTHYGFDAGTNVDQHLESEMRGGEVRPDLRFADPTYTDKEGKKSYDDLPIAKMKFIRSIGSTAEGRRLGIPMAQSHLAPILGQFEELAHALSLTGVVDPQAVRTLSTGETVNEGAGVPLRVLHTRLKEQLAGLHVGPVDAPGDIERDSQYFDPQGLKEYIAGLQSERPALAKRFADAQQMTPTSEKHRKAIENRIKSAGQKLANHDAHIAQAQQGLASSSFSPEQVQHQLALTTQAEKLLDPANRFAWAHTMHAVMGASTGNRVVGADGTLQPQHAHAMFSHVVQGYKEGTRSVENMARLAQSLEQATATIRGTGSVRRGDVTGVLEALGQPTDRESNPAMATLEGEHGFTNPDDTVPLSALTAGNEKALMSLTRYPMVPNMPYTFMGGAKTAQGYTGQLAGQAGLTKGMRGYLEPFDNKTAFGMPKSYGVLAANRMLDMTRQGGQSEYERFKGAGGAMDNQNVEPVFTFAAADGKRYKVRASQLALATHEAWQPSFNRRKTGVPFVPSNVIGRVRKRWAKRTPAEIASATEELAQRRVGTAALADQYGRLPQPPVSKDVVRTMRVAGIEGVPVSEEAFQKHEADLKKQATQALPTAPTLAPQQSGRGTLTYHTGDIFGSTAQTLVNTVNMRIRGDGKAVMGRGLAKQMAERFPGLQYAHAQDIQRGRVGLGRPALYRHDEEGQPDILNFPTKDDYANPSKLEWIEQGMAHLAANAKEMGISSIAFPKMGTENGKLDWSDVGPVMAKHFGSLMDQGINVQMYTQPGDTQYYPPSSSLEQQQGLVGASSDVPTNPLAMSMSRVSQEAAALRTLPPQPALGTGTLGQQGLSRDARDKLANLQKYDSGDPIIGSSHHLPPPPSSSPPLPLSLPSKSQHTVAQLLADRPPMAVAYPAADASIAKQFTAPDVQTHLTEIYNTVLHDYVQAQKDQKLADFEKTHHHAMQMAMRQYEDSDSQFDAASAIVHHHFAQKASLELGKSILPSLPEGISQYIPHIQDENVSDRLFSQEQFLVQKRERAWQKELKEAQTREAVSNPSPSQPPVPSQVASPPPTTPPAPPPKEVSPVDALLFGDDARGMKRPDMEQQAFIASQADHRLLQAGPGAGKTSSVAKAAWLWAMQGMNPQHILSFSALRSGVGALKENYEDVSKHLFGDKGEAKGLVDNTRTYASAAYRFLFNSERSGIDEQGNDTYSRPVLDALGLGHIQGVLTDPGERELLGKSDEQQKMLIEGGLTQKFRDYWQQQYGEEMSPDLAKEQLTRIQYLKKQGMGKKSLFAQELAHGQKGLQKGEKPYLKLPDNKVSQRNHIYTAQYQNMLASHNRMDFEDVFHHAIRGLKGLPEHLIPDWIKNAQGIVRDEAQDTSPHIQQFVSSLMKRMQPKNRKSIVAMDVSQAAMPGGIHPDLLEDTHHQLFNEIGGTAEDHTLHYGYRGPVEGILANNSYVQQPELKGHAKSPMQIPAPGAPLGTFPELRGFLHQGQQNEFLAQSMLAKTGLDWNVVKKNIAAWKAQGYDVKDMQAQHLFANMPWNTTVDRSGETVPVLPSKVPLIAPTNDEIDVFGRGLKEQINKEFDVPTTEHIFNAMLRKNAPSGDATETEKENAKYQHWAMTNPNSRSFGFMFPHIISTRRGMPRNEGKLTEQSGWSNADWLRQVFIGQSRDTIRNTFAATDRPMNKFQSKQYAAGITHFDVPPAITNITDNPSDRHVRLFPHGWDPSLDNKNSRLFKGSGDQRLVNIGHPDPNHQDAVFVPEYHRRALETEVKDALASGISPDNKDFFPQAGVRNFFVKKIADSMSIPIGVKTPSPAQVAAASQQQVAQSQQPATIQPVPDLISSQGPATSTVAQNVPSSVSSGGGSVGQQGSIAPQGQVRPSQSAVTPFVPGTNAVGQVAGVPAGYGRQVPPSMPVGKVSTPAMAGIGASISGLVDDLASGKHGGSPSLQAQHLWDNASYYTQKENDKQNTERDILHSRATQPSLFGGSSGTPIHIADQDTQPLRAIASSRPSHLTYYDRNGMGQWQSGKVANGPGATIPGGSLSYQEHHGLGEEGQKALTNVKNYPVPLLSTSEIEQHHLNALSTQQFGGLNDRLMLHYARLVQTQQPDVPLTDPDRVRTSLADRGGVNPRSYYDEHVKELNKLITSGASHEQIAEQGGKVANIAKLLGERGFAIKAGVVNVSGEKIALNETPELAKQLANWQQPASFAHELAQMQNGPLRMGGGIVPQYVPQVQQQYMARGRNGTWSQQSFTGAAGAQLPQGGISMDEYQTFQANGTLDQLGGDGGGRGSSLYQVSRIIEHISSMLGQVGQAALSTQQSAVLEGSKYRQATTGMSVQSGMDPSGTSGFWDFRSASGSANALSVLFDPMQQLKNLQQGKNILTNIGPSYNPRDPNASIGNFQSAYLPEYSDTQVAQGFQTLTSSTNEKFNIGAQGGTNRDIMGMAWLTGMDPTQLAQTLAQISGSNAQQNAANPNWTSQDEARVLGMVHMMTGDNMSGSNVPMILDMIQNSQGAVQGINPGGYDSNTGQKLDYAQTATPEIMAIGQTALNGGMSYGNLGAVSDTINTLAQIGTDPNLEQQYALNQIPAYAGRLTGDTALTQFNYEQDTRTNQLAQLRLQENILGGVPNGTPIEAQHQQYHSNLTGAPPPVLNAPPTMSLPQLQLKIDQADIQMQTANLNMAGISLGQAQNALQGAQLNYQYGVASYNENLAVQNQLYGGIGQDTSRTAYFAWQQNQNASAYNSTSPAAYAQIPAVNTFGVKNAEFYAGIENQRAMLVDQQSPLLKDAAFEQQMKYLNEQEAFYKQELAITNEQRAFEKTWQLKLLNQQASALHWQERMVAAQGAAYDIQKKQYALAVLENQYKQKQDKLDQAYLVQQTTDLNNMLVAINQHMNGQTGAGGVPIDPAQMLQNIAAMHLSTQELDQKMQQLQLSGADKQVFLSIIKELQSPHGMTLAQLEQQFATGSDASLQKALNVYNQNGATAGAGIGASAANANLQQGGTAGDWTNLLSAVTGSEGYDQSVAQNTSPTGGIQQILGKIAGTLAPIGQFISGIIGVAGVIGLSDKVSPGAISGISPISSGGSGGGGSTPGITYYTKPMNDPAFTAYTISLDKTQKITTATMQQVVQVSTTAMKSHVDLMLGYMKSSSDTYQAQTTTATTNLGTSVTNIVNTTSASMLATSKNLSTNVQNWMAANNVTVAATAVVDHLANMFKPGGPNASIGGAADLSNGVPQAPGGFETPHVNASFHQKMNYGVHQGVDFAAGQGTPIEFFNDGTVTGAGFFPWGGEVDQQIAGTNLTERYLHLSQIGVTKGQKIKAGQRMGLTGGGTPASGFGYWSSGAHSHVQVDAGNINAGIDPWFVWGLLGPTNISQYYGASPNTGTGYHPLGGASGSGGMRSIPALALGGIAISPTLAHIGEGGQPEAIMPLDKLAGMLQSLASPATSVTSVSASSTPSHITLTIQSLMSGGITVNCTQSASGGWTISDTDKDEIGSNVIDAILEAVTQATNKLR